MHFSFFFNYFSYFSVPFNGWATGRHLVYKSLMQLCTKVCFRGPGPTWSNSRKEGQLNKKLENVYFIYSTGSH